MFSVCVQAGDQLQENSSCVLLVVRDEGARRPEDSQSDLGLCYCCVYSPTHVGSCSCLVWLLVNTASRGQSWDQRSFSGPVCRTWRRQWWSGPYMGRITTVTPLNPDPCWWFYSGTVRLSSSSAKSSQIKHKPKTESRQKVPVCGATVSLSRK